MTTEPIEPYKEIYFLEYKSITGTRMAEKQMLKAQVWVLTHLGGGVAAIRWPQQINLKTVAIDP